MAVNEAYEANDAKGADGPEQGRTTGRAERPQPASPQMRDVVDSVHNAANSVHQAADSVANTIESFAYRVDSVVNGFNHLRSPMGERRAARYQRRAEHFQRRAARYGGGPSRGNGEKPPQTPEERARKRAKELREFYGHLATYAGVILLLALISLANGEFWFLWPAFGWGIAIVFHALSVFGPDHMFDQDWEDRKARDLAEAEQRRAATPAANTTTQTAAKPGEVAEIVRKGISQVAELRQLSLQISKPAIRMQALAICASADNILTVLAEKPDDVRTAHDFVDRYLGPTQTILSQYVRLTGRGVTSAEPALAKVETQDLPLLSNQMRELYERLHRGDLIDLEVASEMLEMELPAGPEAATPTGSPRQGNKAGVVQG